MRFRRGVYASREISAGCKVLLLRLSDDMNENCIVSVPATTLADDLHCAVSRVSEWVKKAKAAGFLSVVKPAKRGRTTVYQGLVQLRPGVTQQEDALVTELRIPSGYAQAYPITGEWVTPEHPPTEGVQTEPLDQNPFDHRAERREEEGRSA